ncbi:hypothetical protein PUR49_00570 [Streptomyces sp. BE147]|uniref:hypothetical protein n=1 Tax=Streptomyces sp. BE147 TaxID=3002524 RepID=UPI002E7787B8|nr:hypothetical protein [Streptomyces sp. BE147]MEE1735063.1 hypothetical protein [Streptomyces sp. BE147]
MLTINLGLLLAVIVVFRLRRRTEARSRRDEKFTVVIVLALGVVIARKPKTPARDCYLGAIGPVLAHRPAPWAETRTRQLSPVRKRC